MALWKDYCDLSRYRMLSPVCARLLLLISFRSELGRCCYWWCNRVECCLSIARQAEQYWSQSPIQTVRSKPITQELIVIAPARAKSRMICTNLGHKYQLCVIRTVHLLVTQVFDDFNLWYIAHVPSFDGIIVTVSGFPDFPPKPRGRPIARQKRWFSDVKSHPRCDVRVPLGNREPAMRSNELLSNWWWNYSARNA